MRDSADNHFQLSENHPSTHLLKWHSVCLYALMQQGESDRIVILGMGNELFGDDGAGIAAAQKLEKVLSNSPVIDVKTTNWGGFRLIDLLRDYNKAIIIDAFCTGKSPAGTISIFNWENLINSVRMVSFHDINLPTAVKFAKQIKIQMPEEIIVCGIEIEPSEEFREGLSETVAKAVDECCDIIRKKISITKLVMF